MRYWVLMMFFLAGSVAADELEAPAGRVILTISGSITKTNSEQGAQFDLQMLEKFSSTSITTNSPWTEGATEFAGVELSVLLKAVGARKSAVRAYALDGYWYDISDVDMLEEYPVVLAYKRDGEYMSARNLGPLWIMFPFDDHPELLTEANKAACVWQLNSLVVL